MLPWSTPNSCLFGLEKVVFSLDAEMPVRQKIPNENGHSAMNALHNAILPPWSLMPWTIWTKWSWALQTCLKSHWMSSGVVSSSQKRMLFKICSTVLQMHHVRAIGFRLQFGLYKPWESVLVFLLAKR